MPIEDSKRLRQQVDPARQAASETEAPEEIVTPIEAEIQNRVEREFEKPPLHKKAIVSVNGHDIAEVKIGNHERAA